MIEEKLIAHGSHLDKKELTSKLLAKLLAHLLHMGLQGILLFTQLGDLLLSKDLGSSPEVLDLLLQPADTSPSYL